MSAAKAAWTVNRHTVRSAAWPASCVVSPNLSVAAVG